MNFSLIDKVDTALTTAHSYNSRTSHTRCTEHLTLDKTLRLFIWTYRNISTKSGTQDFFKNVNIALVSPVLYFRGLNRIFKTEHIELKWQTHSPPGKLSTQDAPRALCWVPFLHSYISTDFHIEQHTTHSFLQTTQYYMRPTLLKT